MHATFFLASIYFLKEPGAAEGATSFSEQSLESFSSYSWRMFQAQHCDRGEVVSEQRSGGNQTATWQSQQGELGILVLWSWWSRALDAEHLCWCWSRCTWSWPWEAASATQLAFDFSSISILCSKQHFFLICRPFPTVNCTWLGLLQPWCTNTKTY